jgi:dihydrofolate reductase
MRVGDGGPILVPGSCTLAHRLLVNGLVDELRLMVFPVSISGGLRVFPDDRTRLAWTLADQVTFPSGVMALTFTPA